ncbi:MAG: porin [Betaproteobacteria bacterium]|nr:porin [Betaproteobacteria bacterium]
MQKKLIALAVAALASGAALAQSNVTVYGTVDVGFAHRSSNMAPRTKSQQGINSGQSAPSLIGFKGVEDLGNGNKVLFVLESGFHTDNGAHRSENSFFNQQAFLGMTGDWGTAIAGRLLAPRYGFLKSLDPFGDGTVGRFGNVYEDYRALGAPVANVDRVNNAVAYVSPSWSGFNVTAAYATNALGQENLANRMDGRTYTLLPRYTNGPIDVGFSWQRVNINKARSTIGTKVSINQWTLGGGYDFGALKLTAAYDDYKQGMSSGIYDPRMKSWLVGLSVPFNQHAIQFSYNQSKLKTERDTPYGKSRQWALGYTYDLSKRTNFYAAYAHVTNKKRNGVYLRGVNVGDAHNRDFSGNGPDIAGYRSGLQFGLKHNF